MARHFTERGYVVDTHVVTPDRNRPDEADEFPDFASYDIVVAMGSVRSIAEPDDISSWLPLELAALRAAHDRGQPLLGICFGAQLLAEALGGSVERSPTTEMGWYEISAVADADLPVSGGPWMQWHHDRFELPPGATLLAQTDVCPQMFVLGRTAATQFHPEVDAAHVEGWLDAVDDAYLAENGQTREAMKEAARRHEAASIAACRELVDWFLDEVAVVPVEVANAS